MDGLHYCERCVCMTLRSFQNPTEEQNEKKDIFLEKKIKKQKKLNGPIGRNT